MSEISQFISTKRKRGSLELSINAIVILVLAIAMLGVGLAFVRSQFGKIAGLISIDPPKNPGNADDPIGLSSTNIMIEKFSDVDWKVDFYNPYGVNWWLPKITCAQMRVGVAKSNWGTDADKFKPIVVVPQFMNGGEHQEFEILIPEGHLKLANGADLQSKKDVCNIEFVPCGTKLEDNPASDASMRVDGAYQYDACAARSPDVPTVTKQVIFTFK